MANPLVIVLAVGWLASTMVDLVFYRRQRRTIRELRTVLAEREKLAQEVIGFAYERGWCDREAFARGGVGRMLRTEKPN